MATQPTKLTERTVADITPTGRDFKVFDTQLKGFHVRVQPTGRKSYSLFYRNNEGRQRTITLGSVSVLKAEQARAKALKYLVDVNNGSDPSQARRERPAVVTFDDLWGVYLTEHANPRKKADSVMNDEILWRLHIGPTFGRSRVDAVKTKDIAAFVTGMSHKRGAANRSLSLMSKMFSVAIGRELRTDNPCKGVERYPEKRKERFLKVEEVSRLQQCLRADHDVGGALAIRFLLLTGARLSEVLNATWEQFDLAEGSSVWIIPQEQLKGATRTRVDLRRPLSNEAAALLRGWKGSTEGRSSTFVFPSRTQPLKSRSDLKSVWRRVRAQSSLSGVRLHDLRHTFASTAINAGASLHLVGKALGHHDLRTTERYAHVVDSSIRGVAEYVSDALSA